LKTSAVAWPGRKLIHQIISICARETTLGYIMTQAGTTDHTGLVFHGLSSALLQKEVATSNCSLGTCNPINFTILKPSGWEQGHKICIMINGKGV
jgi:hypothetical protein